MKRRFVLSNIHDLKLKLHNILIAETQEIPEDNPINLNNPIHHLKKKREMLRILVLTLFQDIFISNSENQTLMSLPEMWVSYS